MVGIASKVLSGQSFWTSLLLKPLVFSVVLVGFPLKDYRRVFRIGYKTDKAVLG